MEEEEKKTGEPRFLEMIFSPLDTPEDLDDHDDEKGGLLFKTRVDDDQLVAALMSMQEDEKSIRACLIN